MKKTFLLLVGLLASFCLHAQTDYSTYYRDLPKAMPVVQQPVIPELRVSLADYQAVPDGVTKNTEAFAKAISDLQKRGGGHLDVPAGIWLTGPIKLKGKIDLHLDRNAIILFSPDKRDFLVADGEGQEPKVTPCITASKASDISITGEGIIDGNGEYWRPVKRGKVSDVEWNDYKKMGGEITPDGKLWYPFNLKSFANIAADKEAQEKMRTHLIRITACDRVLVKGVTLRNSPKFHLVPQRSSNVTIDGVRVMCPWNAQNGDAIDIGNCKDVLIVNNVIDAGDDGICMKGGAGQKGLEDGPCQNINIQYNKVYHAHGGFVIGSEFSGGMKNIFVANNTFDGTDTGLRFKSAPKRGGQTSDIYIRNIVMTDIADQAIIFQTDYVDVPAGSSNKKATTGDEFVPHFNDIHISNVTCHGASVGIQASGTDISGITVTDSRFVFTDKAMDIATNCDVKLSNVQFTAMEQLGGK